MWPWVRARHMLLEGALDVRDILVHRHWIEGWFDYPELYRAAAESIRDNGLAVEIGVWHGRSVIALSDLLRADGKAARLIGVDPFCDTGQFIPGSYAKEWLSIFNANNDFAGAGVEPMVMNSIQAAGHIGDGAADFIFIDGNHLYDAVQEDMTVWWPKVRRGGVMAGHDYHCSDWPDVKPAVDEWAGERSLTVNAEKPRTWWIRKSTGAGDFKIRRKMVDVRVPLDHACNPAIGRDPSNGRILLVFKSSGPRWDNPRLWCGELDPDTGALLGPPHQLRLGPDHLAFEDPRLFEYRGLLWLSYIHGDYTQAVKNRVAICPLEFAKGRYQPAGKPTVFPSPDREDREKEKNWILFESAGRLLGIYSMAPWEVLELDAASGGILRRASGHSLTWAYGEPRGTSSFVQIPSGKLWAMTHSHCGWPDPGGKRYFAGIVEVCPVEHRPVRQTYTPFLREAEPEPGWMGFHVVWPSGALLHGEDLLVSYGRNDHSCHLAWIPIEEIDRKLLPIGL